MKVAIFTDTFMPDVNGVAKTLGRWVDYLQAHGVQCKVFAPESDESKKNGRDWPVVERFYSIPFLLYPECKLAIPNPVNINKTLQQFQPDLIHVATAFNLGLLGLRYAKKHQIPLVASYHTHFDQYLHYYKLQWMEPMLWKYMLWFHQDCRKIYVPSRSTYEYLQDKGLRNLEIWSRGVDVSRFSPEVDREEVWKEYGISSERFVLLYVGRLAPEKSVDVLMNAFDQLPPHIRQNCQLVIAGDGPIMKDLIEQYGGDAHITFTGFVEGARLSKLYAAADLFVFPSSTETFGNVVLEAMASGTPVIGAKAGGVKDNIADGRTGLLCPPGDAAAFGAAVEKLYANGALRKQLAESGRAYSLQQSWDRIFAKLLASYRELTGEREGRELSNLVAAGK